MSGIYRADDIRISEVERVGIWGFERRGTQRFIREKPFQATAVISEATQGPGP